MWRRVRSRLELQAELHGGEPRRCQHDGDGLPSGLEGVERAPFADLLERADLFIFEFGLSTQMPGEPVRAGRAMAPVDRKRLKVVERLFKRAAAMEAETRPPARRMPRRFIGVNVIYNKFWTSFTDHVGANINPFCSQVLAGLPRQDDSVKGKVLRFRARHAL